MKTKQQRSLEKNRGLGAYLLAAAVLVVALGALGALQ